MVTFTASSVPGLYLPPAPPVGQNWGWCAYNLPGPAKQPLDLPAAFGNQHGSFVFAPRPPANLGQFVTDLEGFLKAQGGQRRFVWLPDANAIDPKTALSFIFNSSAQQVLSSMDVPMTASSAPNLTLTVNNGAGVLVGDDNASFALNQGTVNYPVQWAGPNTVTGSSVFDATIPLDGPQRGCIEFAQKIDRQSLHDQLSWGFQAVIADSSSPGGYRPGWYPLASGDGGDQIPMNVLVDPVDTANTTGCTGDRTAFTFTSDATTLVSGYRTRAGWTLTLAPVVTPQSGQQPARLWVHPGPLNATIARDFVACPVGDFLVGVQTPSGATVAPELICGLSGTESVTVDPGTGADTTDRLRFTPQEPAYAVGYPYPQASPLLPPVDAEAKKLDTTFTTSWGALQPANGGNGGHYNSQPKGSSLYSTANSPEGGVLTFSEHGITLDPTAPLPLFPYSLVGTDPGHTFQPGDFTDVEALVIAAVRRQEIGASKATPAAAPPATLARLAANGNGGTTRTTAPSGLVVLVNDAGIYTEIDLGQRVSQAPTALMSIQQPGTPPPTAVQEAFQTADLFLVAAAPGAFGNSFANQMPIGDWTLAADIGEGSSYGDYRNVVIVKGRRGALAEQVKTPSLWTQPSLAIPQGADASELVVVSGWLQQYIADAAAQGGPYFENFNTLVQDVNWTGILVLKADVQSLPSDLNGLLGGIDRTQFNAHHFGFAITKVDPQTIQMSGDSATFGLIYYVDPNFDDKARPPVPIKPATQPFGFTVLTLKVLFANAAVQSFESYAQLSLGELFNQAPADTKAGKSPPYDALILSGALQKHGTTTTYSLGTEGDIPFFFEEGVFNKIEVVQAQFSTQGSVAESGGQQVSARFDLYGFLDFVTIEAGGAPFDLFSFGSTDGVTPRQGLAFSALGVTMSFFEPTDPETPVSGLTFAFDTSRIAFDPARSVVREGTTLYASLQLKLDKLMSGTKGSAPSDLGYLDVATDAALPGVGDTWYGLRYAVDFGTPGALAGKVGLTSYLLLAWSPDGSAQASLLLPGTGEGSSLLSLQGVLKLSIGPIQLKLVPSADGKSKDFMLILNEIALRFLGLLKLPPSGATAFYLFGSTEDDPGPLGWFGVYKGPDPPKPSNGKQLTQGRGD